MRTPQRAFGGASRPPRRRYPQVASTMFRSTRNRFGRSYRALTQPTLLVPSVSRRHAPLGLVVHREVDVASLQIDGMDPTSERAPPPLERIRPARIGVGTGDHHRPGGVARPPSGGTRCDSMDRTVDWVHVRQAHGGRCLPRLLDRYVRPDHKERYTVRTLPPPFRVNPGGWPRRPRPSEPTGDAIRRHGPRSCLTGRLRPMSFASRASTASRA
jgi:hypothetical protein